MKIIQDIKTIHRAIAGMKAKGQTIGFVPTMGYLHQGHAALLRRCKKENDISVLSIFVNPKQFAPDEDFARYPRDLKKDELLAKKENVDIIFHPSVEEVFPDGYRTYVEVEGLSETLCGRTRSGHFKGVATIAAKLLNIISPDVMYLGQKDAQQAAILSKMVQDLNLPVRVKIHPTLREKDGLAMSSRNMYLSEQQRKEAPILFQALNAAKTKILKGERSSSCIIPFISKMISRNTSGRIDYIEWVDGKTLAPIKIFKDNVLLTLAVWFGPARLIDNVVVRIR